MTIEHRRYCGTLEHCPVCTPTVGHNKETHTWFVWKVGPACSHLECSECGTPYGGVETPCDAVEATDDPAVLRVRRLEAARLRRLHQGRSTSSEV